MVKKRKLSSLDKVMFHLLGFNSMAYTFICVTSVIISFKLFLLFFKREVPEIYEMYMFVSLLFFVISAFVGATLGWYNIKEHTNIMIKKCELKKKGYYEE